MALGEVGDHRHVGTAVPEQRGGKSAIAPRQRGLASDDDSDVAG